MMENRQDSRNRTAETAAGFLLPSVIFLLILLRFGIIPFGGKTLLFSDLDSQYVEFMSEYRRILLGQGSFFYSWNAGIGMNFLAIIAYYLASPFNFLLVLFPENGLPLAVSLITVLKIGCAGGAFGLFLRKRYGSMNRLSPLFAVCYALSGWVLGYAFNIMWLDAVIWLPLLCMGIEDLLNGGTRSMTKLLLLFSVSFISQFYMSYMAGVFCGLYLLARLFVLRSSFKNTLSVLLRFALCAGIAAGISAFLLVPTFFVLKNNMGLLGQTFPAPEGNFPFFRIFSKLWLGSFDGVKDCLPHIFCGILTLIGLALFFLKKEIPGRSKAAAALTGFILLFSFWFQPLDFLWHAMDHPSWFPYRYAFLFPFWALCCACEGFLGENHPRMVGTAAGICLIPLVFYAAADGLKVSVLLLNLLFLVLYPLTHFLFPGKSGTSALTALCCVELLAGGCMTLKTFSGSYTSLEAYRSFHGHYRALTEEVFPPESEFWRMEKTPHRNYNDPLGIGYPGVSHFSSVASTRQAEYLKKLGFNCYATWCTYQGATQVTDAMLRIRYEFGEKGKADSVRFLENIQEHPAQFPLFYFAEDDFARYDFMDENVKAIERQDDLLRLLDGQGTEPFFTPIPVELIHAENLEKESWEYFRRIDPDQPAWLDVRFEKDPGKSVYLTVSGASLNYNVIVNNAIEVISSKRDYAPFPVCLDNLTDSGTVDVRAETTTGTLEGGIFAYALDTERLAALSEKLTENAPKIERIAKTEFLLRTESEDRDRLIVSSIPFDAGWHVSADGKELPLKMIHESVLGFILPAGSKTVRVWFRPYGWEIGIGLTCTAALCCAAVFLYESGKKKRKIL